MAHLVTFESDRFEPRAERENPINPIAGEAVLSWLRERLAPAVLLSEPEPEDWGWFSSAAYDGSVYLVGASADLDQSPPIEWAVQIHKRRSLLDKLIGRNSHDPGDRLTAAIRSAIQSEPDFRDLTVDTSS